MFPYIRLAWHIAKAKRQPRIDPWDNCVLPMRVRIGDIDQFMEMNNGRHLTLMDIGRFVFSVRTGLWDVVRANGWGFVVAGGSMRYRKRLKPFQRYELHTRLLGYDEKWFYFQQTTQRGNTWHSSALLRTAVVAKGKLVPSSDVLNALDIQSESPALPDWVNAWIDADEQRPWEA